MCRLFVCKPDGKYEFHVIIVVVVVVITRSCSCSSGHVRKHLHRVQNRLAADNVRICSTDTHKFHRLVQWWF